MIRFSMRRAMKVASLIAAMAFGSSHTSADVVTYYNFDSNLLDSAPAGAAADHLTPIAALGPVGTTYQPGIIGNAVRIGRFAGEASILEAVDSNDLDLTSSWTIEAFVKPDLFNTGEWDRFVTKWFSGSLQWHWAFRLANNGQDLFMNGGQVINAGSTGTVPLNQWSHVAFTGDPVGGIKLWQNGLVVGTAGYQAVSPGTSPMRFGNAVVTAGDAPLQYSGLIDEFQIHDVAQDASYMLNRAAMIGGSNAMTAPPPDSGLVSYFTFDGTTDDVAGAYPQNSGVAQDNLAPRGGSANYEPGRIGQALRVGVVAGDATDLLGALTADVNLPATYTIETWIKPSEVSDSWQRLVLNWGGPDFAYHFAIRNNGGFVNGVSLFHGEADGGQPNVNGGTVVADEWQHVAGVADGQFLTVYLNGEAVAQAVYDGTIHTALTEGLGIGDSASSLSTIKFNGLIDDLAIWSTALTPEQIRYQYQQGLDGQGAVAIPVPTTMALALLLGTAAGVRRRRA